MKSATPLGVEHLHDSGSVMAPYVSASQVFRSLTPADIDAALETYAPASADPPATPAPSNGSNQTPVVTNNNAGSSVDPVDSDPDDTDDMDRTADTDTPQNNRRWRPWRRFFWRGFWAHFGSRVIASPGQHNAIRPADVNQDNVVSASDALGVINLIVSGGVVTRT